MSQRRGPSRGALVKFTLFAIATSLLTVLIGAQIIGSSFNDRYLVKATFDDVGGLIENDLVKVSGAPVGKVVKVEVVDGRAEVHMRVDREVRLPADSSAEVRWRSLIGQRMVYLVPGAQDGRWLKDGSRITATKAVVDLGEIVNTLGPLTRNLDPNQINKILQAVATALQGNEGNLSTMQGDLQTLVSTFASRKDQLTSIVDSFSTLSEIAVKRDKQIARVIDDLVAISEAFAGNTDVLTAASGELAQVSSTLDKVIGGNQAQLDRAIDNIDKFVGTAVLNIDNLERVVQDLPPALRSLFSATSGGHYARINVMCLHIIQGPCPVPQALPGTGVAVPLLQQRRGQQQLVDLVAQLAKEGG